MMVEKIDQSNFQCAVAIQRGEKANSKKIKFDLNPDTHTTTACPSHSLTVGSRRLQLVLEKHSYPDPSCVGPGLPTRASGIKK